MLNLRSKSCEVRVCFSCGCFAETVFRFVLFPLSRFYDNSSSSIPVTTTVSLHSSICYPTDLLKMKALVFALLCLTAFVFACFDEELLLTPAEYQQCAGLITFLIVIEESIIAFLGNNPPSNKSEVTDSESTDLPSTNFFSVALECQKILKIDMNDITNILYKEGENLGKILASKVFKDKIEFPVSLENIVTKKSTPICHLEEFKMSLTAVIQGAMKEILRLERCELSQQVNTSESVEMTKFNWKCILKEVCDSLQDLIQECVNSSKEDCALIKQSEECAAMITFLLVIEESITFLVKTLPITEDGACDSGKAINELNCELYEESNQTLFAEGIIGTGLVNFARIVANKVVQGKIGFPVILDNIERKTITPICHWEKFQMLLTAVINGAMKEIFDLERCPLSAKLYSFAAVERTHRNWRDILFDVCQKLDLFKVSNKVT